MRPRRSEGLEIPNFFGLEFFKKLIAVTVVFGFRSEVFGFRFGLSFRFFGFLCGSGELRRLHQLWRLRQLRSSFFFFVDFLVPSAHLVVEINFLFCVSSASVAKRDANLAVAKVRVVVGVILLCRVAGGVFASLTEKLFFFL